MGLYSDLQKDLKNAFETDLLDTYIEIVVTEFGEPVYDPVSGTPVTPEINYTVKCIRLENIIGEVVDKSTTQDFAEYIILDEDKISSTIQEFKIDQRITDNNEEYRVSGIDVDPAKATHTLNCRRWA